MLSFSQQACVSPPFSEPVLQDLSHSVGVFVDLLCRWTRGPLLLEHVTFSCASSGECSLHFALFSGAFHFFRVWLPIVLWGKWFQINYESFIENIEVGSGIWFRFILKINICTRETFVWCLCGPLNIWLLFSWWEPWLFG